MTLRLKLLLSIALSMLLTFLLGGVLIYGHATDKVETEMTAALAVGARIAANAVDDVEETANARRRLELLVADFNGDRHLRARVTDASGKVIMTSTIADEEEPAPRWFFDLVSGSERMVEVRLPTSFEPIGKLTLEAVPRNETSEAWEDTLKTLALLLLLTGVILVSVYAILTSALRPLDRMAGAFLQVGGERRPIELSPRDPVEYRRVYQAFNSMVDRLGETEAANARLNEQLLTVQEEERADIARDLHDEIGPFLFAVDVEASSISKLVQDGATDRIPARVASIREAISHMQGHVRGILARLRPAALLDVGLAHALDNLVQSWQRRQPSTKFTLDVDVPILDEQLEGTVYRIVQEALSNAVRHARPKSISISVTAAREMLELSVVDDGIGLAAALQGGFGIRGMQERAALHGGRLTVTERPGGGVLVNASLPLPNDDEPRHEDLDANGEGAAA